MAAAQSAGGVPLSTLCPKYLHSNSTSHTWPFSAIAELIDNAYDPDVKAKQFWIDLTEVNGNDCFIFMDNGNGLDCEKMHKMLSFGYSDKKTVNNQKPIGMYGNGFKSGAMRLGRDALVFSRSRGAACVGLLSQTYLDAIRAEQIVVPIVSFQRSSHHSEGDPEALSVCEEHRSSLEAILQHSLFPREEQLLTELRAISSTCSSAGTGTRIIIWNLRRTSTGESEFDLSDRYDIRIRSEVNDSVTEEYKRPERHQNAIPESDHSLRAYCRILYLRPRMQVIIRGQKVKSQLISKSLALIVKDHYKPYFLTKRVPITFGYNTKSKDQYGMMMYHKNRLIKSYERVGCQTRANFKGVGVIGVMECDFLVPTHNKQDFDTSDDKYRKTMNSLATKLEDYWKEIRHKRQQEDPNAIPIEDLPKRPDQSWAQCDQCQRWRKLPDGINCDLLPDKWACHMNPDPQFRSCLVEEEPEDSDDEQTPYCKTYKQSEKKTKLQEEKRRKMDEEQQKLSNAALAEENKALKRKLEQTAAAKSSPAAKDRRSHRGKAPLRRAARAKGGSPLHPSSPLHRSSPIHSSSPLHPSSPLQTSSRPSSPLQTSTPSGAGPSSPPCGDLPVISHVFSLSTPLRNKRAAPRSLRVHAPSPKRAAPNGASVSASLAPPGEGCSSGPSSPEVATKEVDGGHGNNGIVVPETGGAPSPSAAAFDLAGVKMADLPSPPAVSEPTCVTTQTEAPPLVKEEKEEERGSVMEEEEEEERGSVMKEEELGEEEEEEAHPGSNMEVVEDAMRAGVNDGCGTENGDLGGPPETQPRLGGPEAQPRPGPASPGPDRPATDLQTMAEAQRQQDQLLELMQATAQERDSYKELVEQLEGRRAQDREQACQTERPAGGAGLKREHSHQACQTEGPAGLKREHSHQACQTEEEPGPSDETAVQLDTLLTHLDQSNAERDELQNRVAGLEQENASLTSCCEQLQRDRDEQQRDREQLQRDREELREEADRLRAGGTDQEARRLRDLRRGVGRLLMTFVPDLDLDQVNYDVPVIDELLEQMLPAVESVNNA